jgi:hypothetical protein
MKKVKLKFMVVPEFMISHCIVPDKVMVKIIDPEAIFLTGILGESGRKMVMAGIPFYFERKLAQKLIDKKIAEEIR